MGEGKENYNRLSSAARRDISDRFGESWLPPPLSAQSPTGDWLLTAQLDFISSTENAVPIASFIDPDVANGLATAPVVGRESLLVPRLGVEHETLRGRLRTRLGTFVEPSPYADHLPRPHVTGGLELFLFEYWERWSVSTSLDFAQRYYNVGLSIGFWR